MKKYEVLKHSADLQIRVFGENKEELFQNALLGLTENMRPTIKGPEENIKREITIKSLDLPALLVDFLSEMLALSQINKEVYFKLAFSKFSDTELTGNLSGKKVESFGEDIKAVTHHELSIKQNKNSWEAVILFDI